jgi:hypothetical protein
MVGQVYYRHSESHRYQIFVRFLRKRIATNMKNIASKNGCLA